MHQLFDHMLYQQRLKRVREPFLLEEMATMAAERLDDISRSFERVALMSPLSTSFVSHPKCSSVSFLHEQVEVLPFEEASFDALISLGSLHRTNDVPGVLAQAARALKPDGLFLALFLGGETLAELREVMMEAELEISGGAAARVHPTIDVRDAGTLLQRAGFSLPVVDSATLKTSYTSAVHLMLDLRSMGETNILEKRSRAPMTHKLLERINTLYAEKYSDSEGRVTARFDVIAMTGWKPHASQQKPSARGSGKVSLTVLGSD